MLLVIHLYIYRVNSKKQMYILKIFTNHSYLEKFQNNALTMWKKYFTLSFIRPVIHRPYVRAYHCP